MDGVALASVVSSASVALATVGANVWLRRGDRKHELALDYERRAWEAKSAALRQLMAKCDALRSAARIAQRDVRGAPIAAGIQRVTVVQAMQELRFSGSDADLIAFAGRPVRQLVERLDEMARTIRTDHFGELVELEGLQEVKEAAMDRGDFEIAAHARDSEKVTAAMIGDTFAFDVAEVERLCSAIIEAARDDLRGSE